jgi:hypothetical protein
VTREQMRDSRKYEQQAETVMRLAARAQSTAERQVYVDIAEGWRRLATEAARHELREAQEQAPRERRSFTFRDDD